MMVLYFVIQALVGVEVKIIGKVSSHDKPTPGSFHTSFERNFLSRSVQ